MEAKIADMNAETTKIDIVESTMISLEQTREKFRKVESEMLELSANKDEHNLLVEFLEAFEERYIQTRGLLFSFHRLIVSRDKVKSKPENDETPSTGKLMESILTQQTRILEKMTKENRSSSEIRLPRIDIPKFDGNFTEFLGFWDLFKTAVDTNSSYSDSQKLWYLKASLTGEASNLLKNFCTEDCNYKEAKEILEKRYHNKDKIARTYINRFLNQTGISVRNAQNLQTLHDISDEVIRGLKTLKMESRDVWLIHILLEKLDSDTRREWAEACSSLDDNEEIGIDSLLSFIAVRFSSYDFANSKSTAAKQPQSSHQNKPSYSGSKTFAATRTEFRYNCKFCPNLKHSVFDCETLNTMIVTDRIELVDKIGLCKNCLRPNHTESQTCKYGTCKKCNSSNHHTLLHVENSGQPTISCDNSAQSSSSSENSVLQKLGSSLLATAIAYSQDLKGNKHVCRVFLDNGSQNCYISAEYCNKLALNRFDIDFPVSGIGDITTKAREGVNVTIFSRNHNESWNINCAVLPQITSMMPSVPLDIKDWKIPHELQLADPKFNIPDSIDILIGSELFFSLLIMNQISIGKELPILQNTKLGWIVSGNIPVQHTANSFIALSTVHKSSLQLNDNKHNILEQEGEQNLSKLSIAEQKSKNYPAKNAYKNVTGKFGVTIPLTRKLSMFRKSRQKAKNHLYCIIRQLKQNNNKMHPRKWKQISEIVLKIIPVLSKKQTKKNSEWNLHKIPFPLQFFEDVQKAIQIEHKTGIRLPSELTYSRNRNRFQISAVFLDNVILRKDERLQNSGLNNAIQHLYLLSSHHPLPKLTFVTIMFACYMWTLTSFQFVGQRHSLKRFTRALIDGTRVATLWTGTSITNRSIRKLYKLQLSIKN